MANLISPCMISREPSRKPSRLSATYLVMVDLRYPETTGPGPSGNVAIRHPLLMQVLTEKHIYK